MIRAIEEMKRYNARLTTVINELEVLEDGVDVDWSQVVIDYKWIANECEHRRTTLQKRGRTL